MPDVECLGIVHSLDDDWKTYVAPVNARLHSRLYAQISEHYVPYKAYRDMREAIARTYVTYEPVLPTGYSTTRDNSTASGSDPVPDPAALAKTLPDADDWRAWFAREGRAVDQDDELRGRTRGAVRCASRASGPADLPRHPRRVRGLRDEEGRWRRRLTPRPRPERPVRRRGPRRRAPPWRRPPGMRAPIGPSTSSSSPITKRPS